MADFEQELAFEEAVAAASEGRGLTAEAVGEARERARDLVDGGLAAGMAAMRDLSLSIGLPAPRVLFDVIVGAADAPDSRKKAWRRRLAQMSEIKETGCIKVDFPGGGRAFIFLGECGVDHDLSAELDKIYRRVPPERHDEIRKHLSMLVYLGRAAYSQMMAKMAPLLGAIGPRVPVPEGAPPFDYAVLGVDPGNTTLYLPHVPGPRRVGIYVEVGVADEK